MLKWIKGGISAVTGMAEPEYGKDYIHSVADRVKISSLTEKPVVKIFLASS